MNQQLARKLYEAAQPLHGRLVQPRLGVPRDTRGFLSPMAEITVTVVDEVGALASVTTALAREKLNIKDMQVLKVREDEDGVLRLAFATEEESQRAAEVLRRAGHDARRRGSS